MKLILYCFRICPFVEQVNIMLNEKKLECERVHVDIRNKPDWFLKISAAGKVPLLSVDGIVISESSVINEFLDEISSPPSLYPSTPVQKANCKLEIIKGNALILDAYHMVSAKTEAEYLRIRNIVNEKIDLLENQLTCNPYFYGEQFSIIDVVYGPLLFRFDSLLRQYSIDMLSNAPKIKAWSKQILQRSSIHKAFVLNFDEEFQLLLKLKGSILNVAH